MGLERLGLGPCHPHIAKWQDYFDLTEHAAHEAL